MALWQPTSKHPTTSTGFSWRVRCRRRNVFRAVVLLAILVFLYDRTSKNTIPSFTNNATSNLAVPFKALGMTGFRHPTNALPKTCFDLKLESRIAVDRSVHTTDDISNIAASVRDHPMVLYETKSASPVVIEDYWSRTGQSIIWLDQQGVFLAVTQVSFHARNDPLSPIISFLRGQLYDAGWNELKNYPIIWGDQEITFPRTFDIDIPYAEDTGHLGPQDPKLIVDDAEGSEPVIIFNMLPEPEIQRRRREMYMYRPFSQVTTMFTIPERDQREESVDEKNWMPVFYHEDDSLSGPNEYIHFIYNLQPLEVLRCALSDGTCQFTLRQEAPDGFTDKDKVLFGGTNLVHAALHEHGTHIFIGFAGTRLREYCQDGLTRPQLIVLAVTEDNQFHIEYLSNSLDFGETHLTPSTTTSLEASERACGSGRHMSISSISRWQRFQSVDIMTLTFSIDHSTTQIIHVKEINRLVEDLLHGHTSMQHKLSEAVHHDPRAGFNARVTSCAIEAAGEYAERQVWRMGNGEWMHVRG